MSSKELLEIDEEDEEIEEQIEAPLKYNDRTRENLRKLKIDPDNYPDWVTYAEEYRFLRTVDLSRGPIHRKVSRIFRIKAVDVLDPARKRKEWIYYEEEWTGLDSAKNPVPPVTCHIEGMYFKFKRKKEIGEDNKTFRYIRAGQEIAYYIPFTPKNLDEIIKNSYESDAETIKYIVKNDVRRSGKFSYEQFRNWSWEQCAKALQSDGGPEALPFAEKS